MENLLVEYMNKRFSNGKIIAEPAIGPGPVITISRQTGCGASGLAYEVSKVFNNLNPSSGKTLPWHFINREILEKSAKELNLEPSHLHKVITDKERGIMDQIVEALSSHMHKSDQKIMKTVRDVIRQFAEQGNVIIVGRGGAIVSRDIERSLHVRLEAPLEWRVGVIMTNLGFSREYSREYIRKSDEERAMYVQKMFPGNNRELLYDLVLNPSRFSRNQLIETITALARIKGIL